MGLRELLEISLHGAAAWSTLKLIDASPSSVEIRLIDRPFPEPEEARDARVDYFTNIDLPRTMQLLKQRSARLKDGNEYYIGDYTEAAPGAVQKALFTKLPEGKVQRGNFDGNQHVNLHRLLTEGDKTIVEVYQIFFSERMACKDPRFTGAYRKVGQKPYAGVGISTVVESSDGFFVLTQRPIDTVNYPGTLFILGGGLKPKTALAKNLLDEIVEEAGLRAGTHYDPATIRVTAIGADNFYGGGKHARPEITAYVQANIPFRAIEELQRKTTYQTDVSGLVPLSTLPQNFTSRMAVMGATAELLPSAEIALTYAFLVKREQEVGPEQAMQESDSLMRMLNIYERKPVFEVPKFKE